MATTATAPLVRSLPVPVVARATGAHPRTVERWRAGATPRRRRFTGRLDDLRAVLELLGPGLSRAGQVAWLNGSSAYLGGDRPVDLLAAGEGERVKGAAVAYAAGDPT